MKPLLNISIEELSSCQIVKWGYTEELQPLSLGIFKDWLERGDHTPLSYLSDHRGDIRKSLLDYYPQGSSVVSFLFDYRQSKKHQNENTSKLKLAGYVSGFEGVDYHRWIGERLNSIGEKLKCERGGLEFRLSLDIHPVLERDLAYRAGLGWFGKNSMLINQDVGSFNLIGSIVFNQKLNLGKNSFVADHCGHCSACIEACPTDAIDTKTRTLIAKKCISNFTIEQFKDDLPAPKGYPTQTKEIFGCDICQDVCPWNKKSLKMITAKSDSKWNEFFNRSEQEIYNDIQLMSNKKYKLFFKDTSFERLGKKGMLKNLRYYL